MAIASLARKIPIGKRQALFDRYRSRITPNLKLDRSMVSFQANRRQPFFGWFKYKEGFSANLVNWAIDEYARNKPGTLLDPFAGSGTALLVGRERGWDTIGIELLPVGVAAVESRLAAERAPVSSLKRHQDALIRSRWLLLRDEELALKHIPITRGAYSPETEKAIMAYRTYCRHAVRNDDVRRLLDLACLSVLETVSFTRKDGQYLRWDYRARKKRVLSRFDKGLIPSFPEAIRKKLLEMGSDFSGDATNGSLFDAGVRRRRGSLDLHCGSCLEILPTMKSGSVNFVMTSPPYCNRYDYTRTYALELAYLGLDNDAVTALRQTMLSCTVENRAKREELQQAYVRRSRTATFETVVDVFESQAALHEILDILDEEADADRLNNANIPRMVRNYFFEMCFVIYELARVTKSGGRIVMVNDNVQYAGEEVPVDLILSDFAEQFGLSVDTIWTLPRGKGNSSQQMGIHGRSELRKCVYVWRKR